MLARLNRSISPIAFSLRTVVGERRLRTPRHREGGYFPDEALRPYPRTSRAMVGAIAKVYKLGLSTRKIERAAAYVHTMPRISCPRIPSAATCCRVIMPQTHLYCISSDGSADA